MELRNGWMTAKQMDDLKKLTDINHITPSHMEAFSRTNNEYSNYYNSKYDLEHQRFLHRQRVNKYGDAYNQLVEKNRSTPGQRVEKFK